MMDLKNHTERLYSSLKELIKYHTERINNNSNLISEFN